MKFSTALSLCLAPVALAKAVRNVYPDRREVKNSKDSNNNKSGKESATDILLSAELGAAAAGGSSVEEVIIIWFNNGGGAATTTVNPPVVTVTEVAGQAAGATESATQTLVTGASGTVAATGQTHSVVVGGSAGFVYTPDTIEAAVGDMVVFTFMSQNHTVSQSGFTTPCIALAGGMDSGFRPNTNNTVSPPPQVAMQVMVSTPLWFYCRQTGHCGKGMTFSINPTANKTQAMFQAMAIAQNGTGSSTTITGGSSSSSNSSSTSASTTSAAAAAGAAGAVSSTAAVSVASATASAVSSGSTGTGTGTIGSDGSCQCAVVCAVGSFPNVAAQGINNFGGMAGSLPAANAVKM